MISSASIFNIPKALNSGVWFQEWNSVILPIAAGADVITINVIIGRSRSPANIFEDNSCRFFWWIK